VVIDRGEITKRTKKPSKKFRDQFGHTPLSMEEKIPWKCRQLIIGHGFTGALPVMDAVKRTAEKRGVELIILPPPRARMTRGTWRISAQITEPTRLSELF
jgi:hypothetical protein